jgi:sialidase-1
MICSVTALAIAPSRDTVVYQKSSHGFETFRIPSFVRATDGSLIAVAEGRVRTAGPQISCNASATPWQPAGNNTCCYGKLASDFDSSCYDKDVVVKTSTDGGRSWGAFAMLSPGSNATHFYSNALGLVDPATSRVWVMYSRCAVAQGYHGDSCSDVWTYSDTHGRSWVAAPELDRFSSTGVSGVGSGLALRTGTRRGRLLFSKGHLMMSDDHGTSWQRGGETHGGSEQQCAETAADVLVCASRSGWTPKITISTDGGASFSEGYQLDGRAGCARSREAPMPSPAPSGGSPGPPGTPT